jgi:DNA repair protein RecN (Recombination protein N)
MDDSRHLSLLDQFGAEDIFPSQTEYQEVFRRYEQTLQKLKALSENDQQTAHRLDLIQFQFDEIQNANLKLNEDEELY